MGHGGNGLGTVDRQRRREVDLELGVDSQIGKTEENSNLGQEL